MLNCCSQNFRASYKFFAAPDSKCKLRQVLFSYCPVCDKAVYKEILTDFDNIRIHCEQLKGIKAQEAYKKALFNQITYFDKVSHGTNESNNWYFGDFEKTKEKDKNGNFIYLQLRRNFNNKKEVLGKARVLYG